MSRVLLLRVPKTSGTALMHFLRDAFEGDLFNQANTVGQLRSGDARTGRVRNLDDIRDALTRCRGLSLHVDADMTESQPTTAFRSLAHLVFDAENEAFFSRLTILTMLRDPLDRFLSEYAFVRRHQASTPGFATDLELGDPGSYLRRIHPNPVLHFLLQERLYEPRRFVRADLEHVQRCIADYPIHVGIFERYEESIDYFARVLGIEATAVDVPRLNVGDSKPEVTSRLLSEFRARNALDIELYQFACTLFDERTPPDTPSRDPGPRASR